MLVLDGLDLVALLDLVPDLLLLTFEVRRVLVLLLAVALFFCVVLLTVAFDSGLPLLLVERLTRRLLRAGSVFRSVLRAELTVRPPERLRVRRTLAFDFVSDLLEELRATEVRVLGLLRTAARRLLELESVPLDSTRLPDCALLRTDLTAPNLVDADDFLTAVPRVATACVELTATLRFSNPKLSRRIPRRVKVRCLKATVRPLE